MSADVTQFDSLPEANEPQVLGRAEFLRMATWFQGGMLLLALGLAWLAGIDLRAQLHFSAASMSWGVGATVPILLLFGLTYRFPIGPFRGIKTFLMETLGPTLARCSWYDLAYVALLAGVSEEFLFRGVTQTWFGVWGFAVGLLASNALFGLAHFVSAAYAILAGLLGLYMGTLFVVTGDANLVPPILCHALYDFVALMVFRAAVRSTRTQQAAT